jgi:hypothetical protein
VLFIVVKWIGGLVDAKVTSGGGGSVEQSSHRAAVEVLLVVS